MKKRLQFSVASLLILMTVAAIVFRWFYSPVQREQGVEHWQLHSCFDYASGVAEPSYKQNVWKECTVISGDGHFCVIQEGGHIIGTTGSWFFSVGIQLPKTLNVDDTIELRSIKVPDASKSSLHVMVSGEVVATEFGHPMSCDLESIDDIPHGKIQIKQIDEKSMTVELVARLSSQLLCILPVVSLHMFVASFLIAIRWEGVLRWMN